MFFILLTVSLGTFLHDLHVSSCDANCADKPVFSPFRLVVQHGDPASASCSVCRHACLSRPSGLEASDGVTRRNGSMILWMVDSMTEWGTHALCYYIDDDDNQCCSTLPVTVYQPPHSVSISFVNHTGSMLEDRQYTLQCTVQDVAPVEDLAVTFYKGQTALGPQQSKNNVKHKTPVTEIFTLNITPSEEDGGVQYWCEAKLELGPEGPQPPPVVMSQTITATVLYHLPVRHPVPILLMAIVAVSVLVLIIAMCLPYFFCLRTRTRTLATIED